jgi:hypothetical protein
LNIFELTQISKSLKPIWKFEVNQRKNVRSNCALWAKSGQAQPSTGRHWSGGACLASVLAQPNGVACWVGAQLGQGKISFSSVLTQAIGGARSILACRRQGEVRTPRVQGGAVAQVWG